MSVIPNAVGVSQLDLKVTTDDGRVNVIHNAVTYYASAASSTAGTATYYSGMSDASAAIDVGDGYLLAVDDEQPNYANLFKRNKSGMPIRTFEVASADIQSESDLEAATRIGDVAYFSSSMSNTKKGKVQHYRQNIFAAKITGSGANTILTDVGYYENLRNDLVAWDQNNGHGLGANYLGFAASTASGKVPNTVDGMNLEGMEAAPGSTTTMYLAFRGPQEPTDNRHLALIVPVTNFTSLVTSPAQTAVSAQFGSPILLDLGGRGIRDIRKNAAGQYLILAGSSDDQYNDFALYAWDGKPTSAPVLLPTIVHTDDNPAAWEGIVSVPNPLVAGAKVQLLGDVGDSNLYGTGTAAKDMPSGSPARRSPANWFTIGAAPANATIRVDKSAVTFPADQLPGTQSTPAQIIVSNAGTAPLLPGKVRVPAGFSVTANTCAGASLGLNQACTISVTFAPSHSGSYDGTVSIATNDRSAPIKLLSIDGHATKQQSGAKPRAVSDLGASARYGTVSLWWSAPNADGNAFAAVDSYVVTPYLNGVAQPGITTPDAGTFLDVTGLVPGGVYTFTVAAHNKIGIGSAVRTKAVIVLAAPAPLAPVKNIAGTGTYGYSGDGGPATSAQVAMPISTVVDPTGNVYFADVNNHVIRKIDTSGTISVFAGIGNAFGDLGDGGPATAASVGNPLGLAVDAVGNVYIADAYHAVVRKVDTKGIITTVAGGGNYGPHIEGAPALQQYLNYPEALAVDAAGNLYIGEGNVGHLGKVDTHGLYTTVAGTYITSSSPAIGGRATETQIDSITSVAVDRSGNVYFTQQNENLVLMVDKHGILRKFAGGTDPADTEADRAQLDTPTALSIGPDGTVYIQEYASTSRLLAVTTSGTLRTLEPASGGRGVAWAKGNLYFGTFANVETVSALKLS